MAARKRRTIDRSVVEAWDVAPLHCIHPARQHESEGAYWATGVEQAEQISTVLPDEATVLDFGCGDGRVAVALADLGYTVIGADSSVRILGRLADTRITKVVSDGTDLKLGPVDAVVCLAVLIHYNYESGRALMAALADVLKPGGVLVLDAPSSDQPTDTGGWIGVTTWDEQERDRYLKKLGLTPVTSELKWPLYRKK